MTRVHPTAIIDPTATIGEGVTVGPYAIIGPHCTVGAGSTISAHAVLEHYVRLGDNCKVSPTAVLGGNPQDLSFGGEPSWVIIGNNTTIREGVTIHRAVGENETTTVGNGCYIMAYSHVAHNSHVGNEVIMANNAILAGHVHVGDFAFISGQTVVHQFVNIGRYAMMGGSSGTRQDLPPFSMCDGRPVKVVGINKVALRRRGFTAEQRRNIQQAFDIIWYSNKEMSVALAEVEAELGFDPHVQELVTFIRTSKRGVHRSNDTPSNLRQSGVVYGDESALSELTPV